MNNTETEKLGYFSTLRQLLTQLYTKVTLLYSKSATFKIKTRLPLFHE